MWNLQKVFSLRTLKVCRFEKIDTSVKSVYCINHTYKFLLHEGTSRVCVRSLTLASLCFLFAVVPQSDVPNCFLWNPYRAILFPIAISHHPCRSGSMEQRCDGCDDDDAMVRQYVGDDAMTMVLHMVRWRDDEAVVYSAIVIPSSHYIDSLRTCIVSMKMASGVNIN